LRESRVPKNRSIIILTISLAVLLGTECGIPVSNRTNAPAPKPIKQFLYQYRFVLADNYIGWVRIDIGVAKAEQWQFENDTVTATIPESGVKQTESELYTTARVQLYYQRAGDLVPVPDSLYSRNIHANGVFVTRKRGRWGPTKGSWYFFVGPRSLEGKYLFNVPPHSNASLPTPGRMAAPAAPETQPPAGPN
jgi:hypothetical protein